MELSKLDFSTHCFCQCYISVIWCQTLITIQMRLLTTPSQGMEMSISQKVATQEIAFGSRYQRQKPKMWQHSNLHKRGSRHGSPKWQCCLGAEKHHNHLSTVFFFPPPLPISSNLPAQPLRQQHFCMEQQLQHLCEGRPFDVLCVDNTQKCCTQAGSKKGGSEKEELEGMRETKTVIERSSHSFCHEMKNTTVPRLAPLCHYALLFPCITFPKYIRLPGRRRRRCYLWQSSPPSFIWDVYVKSMMLGEGEGRERRTGKADLGLSLLVCDQK